MGLFLPITSSLFGGTVPTNNLFTIFFYFARCGQVITLWRWVRAVLHLIMGAQADQITDKDLLNFSWASSKSDREVVWLISCYVWFRWNSFESNGSNTVNGRELFGFMRFKYREALQKSLLSPIPGLL